MIATEKGNTIKSPEPGRGDLKSVCYENTSRVGDRIISTSSELTKCSQDSYLFD